MTYVEMKAQTRFSDFGKDGFMHFSRCLMYFEKARFLIAKEAGLSRILKQSYPQKAVQFVIIKADVRYPEQVPVSYDRDGEEKLVVRSTLIPPFVSKLAFVQELADSSTGQVLIHADIDVALLLEGEGLVSSMNEACRRCLQDYYDAVQASAARRVLS